MIIVRPSPTADSRTCDPSTVSREELDASSRQHIQDVRAALDFFRGRLLVAGQLHDHDKLSDSKGFYRNFQEKFTPGHRDWLDRHYKKNRHHLNEAAGVPCDVNLIDVLDYIADQVMAGMARSGKVRPTTIDAMVLAQAFQNTIALLEAEVGLEN